jgi:hypothetical protein
MRAASLWSLRTFGLHWIGCALVLWLAAATAHAQQPTASAPVVRSKSVEGLGPDAQLTGGIGFGFETRLDNFFLARARLGVLYAAEPWIANLGFTAEVGALAGLGWGAELELSRAGTLFGSAGVARVDEKRWLAHLGIGFTIFGLEWQHVFGGSEPHNALLLEVRLPLGLWWLHKRQEKLEADSMAAARPPAAPQIVHRPTSNPPRLVPGAPPSSSTPTNPRAAADSGEAQPSSGLPGSSDLAAVEAERAARLADAQSARERGDHLAEAMALSRANALRPEPGISLQLAAAELALGKPRSALADWQKASDSQALSAEESARASALRQQITAKLAQLRLSLTGSTSERDAVWIDGVLEPTAGRGYDLPLDPGQHHLEVRQNERVVLERTIELNPGQLLRLELELAHE